MKTPSLGECYATATKQDPPSGEEGGTCCFCHRETRHGHTKRKLGTNFTDTSITSTGDVICPYCMLLKQDSNILRRSMWYLTNDAFVRFKRDQLDEALSVLPDGPEDPLYLYFTSSYQVTGWTRMIWHANTHPEVLRFGFDRETYTVPRNKFTRLYGYARALLAAGFSKRELSSGQFSIRRLRENNISREELSRLLALKDDRIWQIILTLVKK